LLLLLSVLPLVLLPVQRHLLLLLLWGCFAPALLQQH
jgi:hypothetical protein